MPTYHYRCAQCEQHLEVVQSMTDDPVTECAVCGGQMQKVLSPVGIVLKGSGFYRNDNRSKPKREKSEPKPGPKESGKEPGSGDSASGKTASSKTPSSKTADAKSA